ncbi:hypothetical protein ACSTJ6_02725 [Vibrio parahaemolyticus]|uniref:hypothetical protein n=1 Tax=Vibrio antiquarius (strain Ex25) TaxID=150340 RepID=UPI001A241026|nr:hypothetical protein [Vibrio antiquarius]EHI9302107.1 hypothetical protein [Vibrio vulnificus]HAV1371951.1 hypothetical protein [Vibrio parahaemolyticus]MCR9628002.1 hypothetical protein [Vibrio antiquarius]MCR9631636.1 hypothetical protein [Vibrio antiquarius]HAS6397037.1 hypothetical protein [Vibrio vulnificus]
MRSTAEVIRTGIYSDKLLGGLSMLQCYVSIEELMNSLPQEHLLLDRFATSYERSVNKERLLKLKAHLLESATMNTPLAIPEVALYVYGSTRNKHVNGKLGTLQYSKNKAVVLDGFLLISALSEQLDLVDPFTGKQTDRSRLSTQQKKYLESIDVRLSIYFGAEEQIDEAVVSKLFFDLNTLNSKVYSQYITTHAQESPLTLGADRLAVALKLDTIGGISDLNKITKSDSYVTTKSTLIHILLATLGGKGARIEKQLPTHLSNKTLITTQVVNDALEILIPLIGGWISCLESKFKQDKNGFHRSMQIWQALGIVAHYLSNNSVLTESELFAAGQVLGQLDYDKSASHWGNCSAFKKDSSGHFWINATGGGRTFRDKVAEYFLETLRQSCRNL